MIAGRVAYFERAGIQIALTQPIRIEEITLTYVVICIWDWRRRVLPISCFIEKPFQNWTRTTAEVIGSVFLYVDYNVPLAPLRAERRNEAAAVNS